MDRAERMYRTSKVLRRRVPFVERMYRNTNLAIPPKRIGQCRDRHPFDCGHTKCFCCHSDKLSDLPTPQDIRAELNFRDQLKEAGYEASPSRNVGCLSTQRLCS
jgi:hypothetical protein